MAATAIYWSPSSRSRSLSVVLLHETRGPTCGHEGLPQFHFGDSAVLVRSEVPTHPHPTYAVLSSASFSFSSCFLSPPSSLHASRTYADQGLCTMRFVRQYDLSLTLALMRAGVFHIVSRRCYVVFGLRHRRSCCSAIRSSTHSRSYKLLQASSSRTHKPERCTKGDIISIEHQQP